LRNDSALPLIGAAAFAARGARADEVIE